MKRSIFSLLSFIFPLIAGAQFLPVKLGPSVNSEYDEINPVMSPSGDTIYFTRIGHPENTFGNGKSQDIWFSVKDEHGRWAEAQRLSDDVNIGRYNALFSISPDGKKALIKGIYTRKGTFWKKRGLSIITRSGSEWSKPKRLKVKGLHKMLDGRYFSANMNWEHEVLILSFNGSFNSKRSNLFISRKKGRNYKKPFRINKLNDSGNEFAPFISADGKTIYYASNKKRSNGYDIMQSVRKDDKWKKWTAPEPLSDTINSASNESFYKTSKDGSEAYYSSDRALLGNKEIYYIKLFEPNPYIIVAGQVKYKASKIPVVGREIEIYVNDQLADSVEINQETGNYKLVLRLGKDYEVKAVIPDSDFEPVVVAASSLKEMTEMAIDLNVVPWQYAKVTGRLLDKSTGVALPANIKPVIVINGKPSDQIAIEEGTGRFETTFALGSMYTIKALAEGYTSLETKLDLTEVKEFIELEKNIQVEKIKEATVSGRIINKKTFQPIDPGVKISIMINDQPGIVSIDSTTREYRLTLPLGHSYLLDAKAENFYPQSELIDLSTETQNVKIYRDLYLSPLEVGGAVKLENIWFETGKAVLKASSYAELDRVIKFLHDNSGIKIQVAGHTDSQGSETTNKRLSDLRAKAVSDYITGHGIDASRISYVGYGESSPIADNSTEEGRQKNRRVEFIVVENQ